MSNDWSKNAQQHKISKWRSCAVIVLCQIDFYLLRSKNGINSYSIVLPRKPAAVSASFVSTSPTAVDGSAINTTAPMLSPS